MTRKLVTVRQINDIKPIEGADAIECIVVDGWKLVSKKNEFSKGDNCLYFEIDSFLPIVEQFKFLEKSGSIRKMGEVEGYRLRTVKLRGQVSQGLALPLEKFKGFNITKEDIENKNDLSKKLGVILYETPTPAELAGQIKGNFPSFIRKTDQDRIQNCFNKIKDLDITYEVTVKHDGSSCTAYYNNGGTGVCSRNLDLKYSDSNSFWKVVNDYNLIAGLEELGLNIAMQFELVGSGIQGNKEKINGIDIRVFDIWDIDNQQYVLPNERKNIINKLNNTKSISTPLKEAIPIANCFSIKDLSLASILKLAEGKYSSGMEREGLVFKSNTFIIDEYHNEQRISFKVISNKFLLKEG